MAFITNLVKFSMLGYVNLHGRYKLMDRDNIEISDVERKQKGNIMNDTTKSIHAQL